jgi:rod shape-determining protein MreD
MIREQIKYALFLILIIFISLKFSWLYSVYNVRPDILIVFLLRRSFSDPEPGKNVIWGFSAGLALDLVIGDVIGISSLSYCIVCFFTSFYKRTISYLPGYKRTLVYLIMILFSSFLISLVTLSGLGFFRNMLTVVIPSTAYTLVIAVILHSLKPTK